MFRSLGKDKALLAELVRWLSQPAHDSPRSAITFATFVKYQVMRRVISKLNVRQKRNVFQLMRDLNPNEIETLHAQIFLPSYGITLGEFSVFQP